MVCVSSRTFIFLWLFSSSHRRYKKPMVVAVVLAAKTPAIKGHWAKHNFKFSLKSRQKTQFTAGLTNIKYDIIIQKTSDNIISD